MTEKKKILFICHMSTFFTEQISVIKLCLENNITPIIQFTCPLWTVIQGIKTCLELGIDIYDTNGNILTDIDKINSNKTDTNSKITPQNKTLREKFTELKNSPIINWENIEKRFKKRRLTMRKIIQTIKPDLIVLGGDITGHDTCICIKEAHRFNIKVVTLTLIMANGKDPAHFFVSNKSYLLDNPINKLTGLIFKKWVFNYKGTKLLRLPSAYVWYYKLKGIEPPLPWVHNSGYSDAIFLEGKEWKDYYIKSGLNENKLYITGSYNHDLLYAKNQNKTELKQELYKKYNFDTTKKLIIIALHPEKYMNGITDFEENADKLNDYWIPLLKGTNCNIIGCPHPSCDINYYKKYESDNFKIYDGYTIDIIGLCDIFITNFSSTIKWAIMSGIPVINYDLTLGGYDYYNNTPGVITIENRRDFETQLNRLTTDESYYNDIMQKQLKKSQDWGVLDGKAGERILAQLNSMMEKK